MFKKMLISNTIASKGNCLLCPPFNAKMAGRLYTEDCRFYYTDYLPMIHTLKTISNIYVK